jgi:hypothetical protein
MNDLFDSSMHRHCTPVRLVTKFFLIPHGNGKSEHDARKLEITVNTMV